MVRHIVIWNFRDEFSDTENKENALIVKMELEKLAKIIDGIIELNVYTNALPSSNKDIILNSLFVSKDTLSEYQNHPEYKRVSEFVSTVLQNRACIDYYEK